MKRNLEEPTTIDILNRRKMLVLMGATAVATFAGCGDGPYGPYTQTIVAGCLVSPAQTEGPYSWTRSSAAPTSVRILQTIR